MQHHNSAHSRQEGQLDSCHMTMFWDSKSKQFELAATSCSATMYYRTAITYTCIDIFMNVVLQWNLSN